MATLNDSLVRLVSRGIVDPLEAYNAALDRESLLRGFQVANIAFDPAAVKGGSPVPAGEKTK